MALELSHRFVLKNRVNLLSDPSNVSPFGPLGLEMEKDLGSLNIDIGDLPVLATLRSDNVGGIMGSDILMRCDILYFDLSAKPLPIVTMYNKREM